jgi:2-amino-4-hydroxy-6-hydroxymethyldihydropteridine diphosphokinase
MEFGLSLGSNLGDRVAHLRLAHQTILAIPGVRAVAHSLLYETEPVDVSPQYAEMKFLNAVLIMDSDEDAQTWLKRLNNIETELGRVRTDDKNAPRTIDIDILYAGDQCIDSGGLIVPHPRWATRRFVLQPLSDVRGDMILPGQTASVAHILSALESDEELTLVEEDWS